MTLLENIQHNQSWRQDLAILGEYRTFLTTQSSTHLPLSLLVTKYFKRVSTLLSINSSFLQLISHFVFFLNLKRIRTSWQLISLRAFN